jgi:hypothetical protein
MAKKETEHSPENPDSKEGKDPLHLLHTVGGEVLILSGNITKKELAELKKVHPTIRRKE